MAISEYWRNQGKTQQDKKPGKTWELNGELMCDECCNKDRETSCSHLYRPNCRYCLGTGINATV